MSGRAGSPGLPVALVIAAAALALVLALLQGRFDRSDVRKAVALAMRYRPAAAGPSVFDALVARGEGDPRCDGEILSALLGDVRVRCATPARPADVYTFRVLLDGQRPPRPQGAAAASLVAEIEARRPPQDAPAPGAR